MVCHLIKTVKRKCQKGEIFGASRYCVSVRARHSRCCGEAQALCGDQRVSCVLMATGECKVIDDAPEPGNRFVYALEEVSVWMVLGVVAATLIVTAIEIAFRVTLTGVADVLMTMVCFLVLWGMRSAITHALDLD
jgi:hypothetical protein